MSDVEKLFYRLQEQTGGNKKWGDLGPQQQHIFIQAVNIILALTSEIN